VAESATRPYIDHVVIVLVLPLEEGKEVSELLKAERFDRFAFMLKVAHFRHGVLVNKPVSMSPGQQCRQVNRDQVYRAVGEALLFQVVAEDVDIMPCDFPKWAFSEIRRQVVFKDPVQVFCGGRSNGLLLDEIIEEGVQRIGRLYLFLYLGKISGEIKIVQRYFILDGPCLAGDGTSIGAHAPPAPPDLADAVVCLRPLPPPPHKYP